MNEADQLAKGPPDGKWGWVIVFASHCINMIVNGIIITYGLFINEVQNYFNASLAKTALVGSLVSGLTLIMAPISSTLAKKYGFRLVTLFGALISTIGFFASVYSPTINYMIFLYGFIGGTGFGLMFLPSVVIVNLYFNKKRATANGLAVCGTGIGTLIFSFITRPLLDRYGWKGFLWITAGITFNCCIFASLFRPLLLKSNQEIVPKQVSELEESKKLNMNITSGDLAKNVPLSISIKKESNSKKLSSICFIANDLFSFYIFKSTTFNLVCLSSSLYMMAFLMPLIYLPSFAKEECGVDDFNAKISLIIMGIFNTIGRIISGWLTDKSWVNSIIFYNGALFFGGIITIIMPLFKNFIVLNIYMAFYGFCTGTFLCLRTIVLVDLLGIENLTTSCGILFFFQGMGLICGTPIGGAIKENIGSYIVVYAFAGSVLLMSGLIVTIAKFLSDKENKLQRNLSF